MLVGQGFHPELEHPAEIKSGLVGGCFELHPVGSQAPLTAGQLGAVDGVDLGLMLMKWGQPNPGIPDCNGDNFFDGLDLGIVLVHWGSPT